MKKIILIAISMAFLAGLSVFGQGYFQFTTGKSQVWDGFSSYPATTSSHVNVAFLWAVQGAVPVVESILNGTPTDATIADQTWNQSEAWTAILNDPNFTLAVNSGSGNSLATVLCLTSGAIDYNGGSAFAGPLATTPGGVYTLFMIGWYYAYATPALAAAANTAVGWSQAFNYTATASTSVPNSMNGVTPPFGVGAILIPEPGVLALVSLGGLSLLLFRWRS